MIEELSYRELQKEVADRTDINPVGKTKVELKEILRGIIEPPKMRPVKEIKKPSPLPEPQKDFNLMTWKEGESYIKWAAEDVGYNPAHIKVYLREAGFINYSSPRVDEIYTSLAKKRYMKNLLRKKIHQ